MDTLEEEEEEEEIETGTALGFRCLSVRREDDKHRG